MLDTVGEHARRRTGAGEEPALSRPRRASAVKKGKIGGAFPSRFRETKLYDSGEKLRSCLRLAPPLLFLLLRQHTDALCIDAIRPRILPSLRSTPSSRRVEEEGKELVTSGDESSAGLTRE